MVRGRRPRLLTALAALVVVVAAAAGVGCADDGEVAEPAITSPTGWEVTVYHTAVERFHEGPPKRVTGCITLDCASGNAHIGYYPSDFVDAVEFGGSGRLETGRYAGQYLNWSPEIGFWVDGFPRTGEGTVLVPFTTAAADPDELAVGTVFALADCGTLEGGGPVPTAVCDQLRSAFWTVADEIPADIAGERHVDLYVGDETLETFANGSAATNFVGVGLTMENAAVPANPFDPATPDVPPPPGPTSTTVAPGLPRPPSTTTTTTSTTRTTTATPTRPTRPTPTSVRPGPG